MVPCVGKPIRESLGVHTLASKSEPKTRKRLSRKDWELAAINAIAAGGPADVAVEPLARSLGVTKGSFYWFFSSRDELLVSALERWEQYVGADRIEELERIPDPRTRLETLLANTASPEEIKRGWKVTVALTAHADDPLIQPVMERVTVTRLEYLEKCFREIGHSGEEAQELSTIAYSLMLGLVQLVNDAPEAVSTERLAGAYARLLKIFF